MNLAQQAWQEGQMDLVQHLQALEPKRPEDPDLRGFEWYYSQRLCQLDLRTLGHSGGVTSVAFSPDGRRIASAGLDGPHGEALGRRHGPGSRSPRADTRTASAAWRSAPTAAASPPPAGRAR